MEDASNNRIPDKVKKAAEAAIKDYDAAIKLQPRLFSAHYNKGIALKTLGKEKQAVKCFDRAIKIGLKVAPYELSVAQEANSEYIGSAEPMYAMSSFIRHMIDTGMCEQINGQKIVQLSTPMTFISNQNDPVAFAYYHKGTGLAKPNLKRYKEAIDSLNKAIELNPNVPQFYLIRGLIYAGTGQGEKAFDDHQEAMRIIRKMSDLLNQK